MFKCFGKLFEKEEDKINVLSQFAEIVKQSRFMSVGWYFVPINRILTLKSNKVLIICNQSNTRILGTKKLKRIVKMKKVSSNCLRIEFKDSTEWKFDFIDDDPDDWINLILELRFKPKGRIKSIWI